MLKPSTVAEQVRGVEKVRGVETVRGDEKVKTLEKGEACGAKLRIGSNKGCAKNTLQPSLAEESSLTSACQDPEKSE